MGVTLLYTDDRFVFAGKSYPGVPLLLDSNNHFVQTVCDYLRNLVLFEHEEISTVKTYAEYLQLFWAFLCKEKISYDQVNDVHLLSWINQQRKRGNMSYVIAARCDAVFGLYYWMEKHARIQRAIRIPGFNDQTPFEPLISSRAARPTRFRRSRHGIVMAVRPKRNDSGGIQPTPSADDITKLYAVSDNDQNLDLTERNHLLIDWIYQTGVRRKEFGNLTVDQIPEWSVIDGLRAKGHAYELRLTMTKGGSPRHIAVLPQLLEHTREWIEGPRADIVKRFKKAKPTYREPREVFISSKTGLALNLTSISNLFKSFFSAAGVRGTGHRIRASFLTNLLHAEVEAALANLTSNGGTARDIDWELIIRKVAERAGHRHVESLRSYVTLLKKRYNRLSGQDDLVTIEMLLNIRSQELARLDSRIAQREYELQQYGSER